MSGTFSLNTSVSKQKYTFQKSSRFWTSKKDTTISAYPQKDYFVKPTESGRGRAFGSSSRFNYYESPGKKEKSPSPVKYNLHSQFGDNVKGGNVNGPQKEFTFGVGRDNMQKMFVEDIKNKGKVGLLSPGPGNYEPKQTFGS